ncbi:UNVERIFIED_CONTAM: hypothetical protein Sindi_0714200 [Sesamum indicum]
MPKSRKLEDRMECLNAKVFKLKEAKKDAIGQYKQAKREVKMLQRLNSTLKEDQAEELKRATDQARLNFHNTNEGHEYLEGY